MGSQTLELKCANHKSNMISELQELYLNDALLDVTIACGEFTLKAHKTVLSACSTFFRKLFQDNPCKHPILIMTDVDIEVLKVIVEFMYQGEIHISQEKLTSFLRTAERLKVKGLTNMENMNLNTSEQLETSSNSHYAREAWECTNIHPQIQDAVKVESVHNSSTQLTGCLQNDANKEVASIKLEHESPHSDHDSCIYWQSECFDQASCSSVLSICTSPNQPVSCQMPTSSVVYQPPSPVVSPEVPTSFISYPLAISSDSHELEVPLNNENFAHSEDHIDNGRPTDVREELGERDIISANMFQSKNCSSVINPICTKPSFEALEQLSSQSSLQDCKTEHSNVVYPNISNTSPMISKHLGRKCYFHICEECRIHS